MSPALEKLHAEIAALGISEEYIGSLASEIVKSMAVRKALGLGRGKGGEYHLDTITDLQSRLDAMDDRIDALIPDDIRNDGLTTFGYKDGWPIRGKIGVTAEESTRLSAERATVADMMMKENGERKAALQSAETIRGDDKLHIETLQSTITILDERNKDMLANIQGWKINCDEQGKTIATLNTEIQTRDRLLDDQAATIGRLEESVRAKQNAMDRQTKIYTEALQGMSK